MWLPYSKNLKNVPQKNKKVMKYKIERSTITMWRTLFDTYNAYQDTQDRYHSRNKFYDYDPFPMSTRVATPYKRNGKRSRNTVAMVNRGLPRGTSVKPRGAMVSRNYFKYHTTAFPQHQFEKIRWNTTISNTTLAATTYVERPYILNGPYDPDGAASATQPAGWAKLMAVYTKCYVRKARIRVDFMQVVNTAFANLSVGITVTTNDTTLATLGGAISPGLVVWKTMGDGTTNVSLTHEIDIRKFLGITIGQDGSTSYVCTTTQNPAQYVCAHVWLYNHYGSSAIYGLNITVDYDCDFYDPIPVT